MPVMRYMMVKLKLTVNETKTRRCRGPDEPFNFLGYTIGRLYSPRTGWADIGVRPSDRSLQKLNLRAQTDRRCGARGAGPAVWQMNRLHEGLGHYIYLGAQPTGLHNLRT